MNLYCLYMYSNLNKILFTLRMLVAGWLVLGFETVFQSVSSCLHERRRKKKKKDI